MADDEPQKTSQSIWTKQDTGKIDRPRRRAGVTISAIYLVAMAVYAIAQFGHFREMTPNEFGDFLSGVFAPLAFLWLVLGFFQQGDELRQSSEALWLQGQELQNSVEQQRELVNVTREQLTFERDRIVAEAEQIKRQAQPDFVFVGGSHWADNTGSHMTFHLLNRGNTATDVKLKLSESRTAQWAMIRNGDQYEVNILVPDDHELGPHEFILTYHDALGAPGSVVLKLTAVSVGKRRILRLP
jgi:hypothetical protein